VLLFLLQNARKCVWRPVSDRTRWGEGYTAPQTLAGFKGVEIGMGKREERREREWERERGRKEGIRICLFWVCFLRRLLTFIFVSVHAIFSDNTDQFRCPVCSISLQYFLKLRFLSQPKPSFLTRKESLNHYTTFSENATQAVSRAELSE